MALEYDSDFNIMQQSHGIFAIAKLLVFVNLRDKKCKRKSNPNSNQRCPQDVKSQDRDETETVNLQDPDETETFHVLPCDCEAYARYCYHQMSLCLSVCPSVKRVYCDKTR